MTETESIPLFSFSQEDLLANRRGEISAAQRKTMLQATYTASLVALFAGIAFLVIFLLSGSNDLVIAFSLFLPWLLFSAWLFWQGYPKAGNNIVKKTTGEVTFQRTTRMGGLIWVGDLNFPAFTISASLFSPGQRYHIYYITRGRRILSFEKEEN